MLNRLEPILLYASDFWGCLKIPINNPIENFHMEGDVHGRPKK